MWLDKNPYFMYSHLHIACPAPQSLLSSAQRAAFPNYMTSHNLEVRNKMVLVCAGSSCFGV